MVESLLDAAELLFQEIGYASASTSAIADRACVPVGTLYRWFPDKAALAEGLVHRYLTRLADAYDDVVATHGPTIDIIRDLTFGLAAIFMDSPGAPALLTAANETSGDKAAGVRLSETVQGFIRALLQDRAPGIRDEDLHRIAEVTTTIGIGVLTRAARLGEAPRAAMVDELANVYVSWLYARFPTADDPVWSVPEPDVVPLVPSVFSRSGTGRPPSHRPAPEG